MIADRPRRIRSGRDCAGETSRPSAIAPWPWPTPRSASRICRGSRGDPRRDEPGDASWYAVVRWRVCINVSSDEFVTWRVPEAGPHRGETARSREMRWPTTSTRWLPSINRFLPRRRLPVEPMHVHALGDGVFLGVEVAENVAPLMSAASAMRSTVATARPRLATTCAAAAAMRRRVAVRFRSASDSRESRSKA